MIDKRSFVRSSGQHGGRIVAKAAGTELVRNPESFKACFFSQIDEIDGFVFSGLMNRA